MLKNALQAFTFCLPLIYLWIILSVLCLRRNFLLNNARQIKKIGAENFALTKKFEKRHVACSFCRYLFYWFWNNHNILRPYWMLEWNFFIGLLSVFCNSWSQRTTQKTTRHLVQKRITNKFCIHFSVWLLVFFSNKGQNEKRNQELSFAYSTDPQIIRL